MATVKQPVVAKVDYTPAALSTLASANYTVTSTKNNTANQPTDLLVELAVTPGATSGNKQATLFAKASLDGVNWQSGPESGTTTTDESNLTLIGQLPLLTASGPQSKIFPVAAAFGNVLPPYIKFVVKNDCGSAFTAGALAVSEVQLTVA